MLTWPNIKISPDNCSVKSNKETLTLFGEYLFRIINKTKLLHSNNAFNQDHFGFGGSKESEYDE